MNTQEFQTLTMKVLEQKATPEELSAFQAFLDGNPSRREEFESIQQTLGMVRRQAALLKALDANTPELPAHRLGELQSAVRREFPSQRPSPYLSSRILAWLQRLSAQTALAGSLALLIGACLIAFLSIPPREITIGHLEGYRTRGSDAPPPVIEKAHVRTLRFHKDEDFEKWQEESLSWKERAKLWIDEENDAFQIVVRDERGRIQRRAEKLADSPGQRQRQLEAIADSLRN